MTIKLLITGLLGLVSAATFAQKFELKNAQDSFDAYTVAKTNKFTIAQAPKDLSDAKTSIDKASVNAKTAEMPMTSALKSAIYSSYAVQDSVPATSMPNFTIAAEALKKAKSLDSVKQDKDVEKYIANTTGNLAQYKFNEGRAEFADKKFDQAYKSFAYFQKLRPDNDTLAMFVTGLSAANAGATDPKYYASAISNYGKLVNTSYSQTENIYYDLANIYLNNKDTTSALRIAAAGVAKFPSDNKLRKREIEISLQSGKSALLIGKIDSAIANDPKNKTLYYYEGLTYSQIAESFEAKKIKTKDVAAKKALQVQELANYGKAAEQYKKTVALDSTYFEANLNLGYVLIKPAIEDFNDANELPTNQQKEYDAESAKAKTEFAAAKPYLLKAVELNPKSVDALQNLKTYYLGTKDLTDANATQKKIDALGAGSN